MKKELAIETFKLKCIECAKERNQLREFSVSTVGL